MYGLDFQEKVKYDFADQGSYFGYKGCGQGIIDKQGTRDRNEFYNLSKDGIFSLSAPLPSPAMLNAHRNLYKSYITSLLSLHACRSNQKLVQQVSKPSQATKSASPKHLRKSNLKGIALGKHTDFGSVTVLFNRLGGLQVRLSTTFAAAQCYRENPLRERLDVYVRPLAGHCIVNVGDALVMFSNGMLWRNIHCVVAPPGEQGCVTRYSLVDLCRPEDDVVVLESMVEGAEQRGGESVMAKEWVLRGALGRREE